MVDSEQLRNNQKTSLTMSTITYSLKAPTAPFACVLMLHNYTHDQPLVQPMADTANQSARNAIDTFKILPTTEIQTKNTRRRGRQPSPAVNRFKWISLRQRLVLA